LSHGFWYNLQRVSFTETTEKYGPTKPFFTGKTELSLILRLILEIFHDPDSRKHYFSIKIGRNKTFKFLLDAKKLILAFFVLLLPISVSAGVVGDFLSNLFNISNENSPVLNRNLQNMALLVALSSPFAEETPAPMVDDNALVPSTGPSGTAFEVANQKPSSDQISIYVVREGDTLSQIAEMFDVSVNTIKWSNNLPSNTLKVGDTLVILPISGVKYTVAKGDTLASVAKKYKGDIDEIVAYNNLDKGSSLAVGSIIIIPDGEVQTSTSGYFAVSNSSNLKEYKGYYIRPVVGGRRSQGLHGHNAIDIAASVGTPILAMADGEVIISKIGGWNGGYGNYVVIRHPNGTQTLYAHNSKNLVSVGGSVKQGDVIGLVGVTGKITGPHLHFEIRGAKNPF